MQQHLGSSDPSSSCVAIPTLQKFHDIKILGHQITVHRLCYQKSKPGQELVGIAEGNFNVVRELISNKRIINFEETATQLESNHIVANFGR